MAFLRVVEVLPPLFRRSDRELRLLPEVERFKAEVREIRESADIILVANVKDRSLLKLETVHAAAVLERELGVTTSPVVVVRDQNRPQFLSTVLAAVTAGLKSIMVAWGDGYAGPGASNVRDYASLADAIRDVAAIRAKSASQAVILAPVNVERLSDPKGLALAKGRLRAGADLLLAQPPTTDAGVTFRRHLALLERSGLREKVLLGVFPFKGSGDVLRYERLFGWSLPKGLHRAADSGRGALLEAERAVARRARAEGLPGIYVSTRGEPRLAKAILA